ncbi:unnamed protein product [Closterium sp. Yama58-4]|nr:unnamed protein product [Closterium sp. Yama58-4]
MQCTANCNTPTPLSRREFPLAALSAHLYLGLSTLLECRTISHSRRNMISSMPLASFGCGRRNGAAALVTTLMIAAAFMPHSKAGRLLQELSTSAEPCTVNNCGKNAFCYKNATGSDTCRCKNGYTMTPHHGCQVQCNHFNGSCPGNATCHHHVTGVGGLCFCNHGFRMINASCIFACDRITCPDNSNCAVDPDGNAVCSCNDGYDQMPDGTCVEACTVNNCGDNSFCYKEAGVDMCACNDGYTMTPSYGCQVTCDEYGNGCPGNATCNHQVTGVNGLCSCDHGFRMVNASCISVCEMTCPANSFCEVEPPDNAVMCFCNNGYSRQQDGTCVENCDNKICGRGEECVSYEDGATCECLNGFVRVAGSCVEACTMNLCGENSVCYKDTAGEAVCACNDGYTMTAIDGCLVTCDDYGGGCPGNATCHDHVTGVGGLCYCDVGFRMVNARCIYVCEEMTCPANASCVNPDGEAVCICNYGYEKNSDGTCVDICDMTTCPDNSTCNMDSEGYAKCICNEGYNQKLDGTCVASDKPPTPPAALASSPAASSPPPTAFAPPPAAFAPPPAAFAPPPAAFAPPPATFPPPPVV